MIKNQIVRLKFIQALPPQLINIMKFKSFIFAIFLIAVSTTFCFAQKKDKVEINPEVVRAVKSSPAYAEVLLRRTELKAQLEDLLVAYTPEFPKVKEVQFQLNFIKLEMEKFYNIIPSESQKLSLALGKLIVRKIELETDLWSLRKRLGDDHPDVKKAKKKVLIFEAAINDVLF